MVYFNWKTKQNETKPSDEDITSIWIAFSFYNRWFFKNKKYFLSVLDLVLCQQIQTQLSNLNNSILISAPQTHS